MRDHQSRLQALIRDWRRGAFVLALAVSTWSGSVAAQANAEPALPAARELWRAGTALYQAGDYAGAGDRFDRAYEIEHTPSLGVWVARSWSRAGRLMAALARYREISEQNLPPDAPLREWNAKRDADAERQGILARIPSIVVAVDGPFDDRVQITVNGEPLGRTEFGARRLVDPGRVRIHGTDGKRVGELEVDLNEGEVRTVRLVLALPAATRAEGAEAAEKGAHPGEPANGSRGNGTRLFGYVAMGVGGASLLTGVAFGFMALHDRARLATLCPSGHCPPSLASDVDTYEAEKTIAAVGMLAGATLSITGLVVYFAAPRRESSAGVGVFVTGQGAGVAGRF